MADENILKRIRDTLNRAGLVVPSDTVRQIVGMVLEAAARQETPTADNQALASQYTDRTGQDQRASAGGGVPSGFVRLPDPVLEQFLDYLTSDEFQAAYRQPRAMRRATTFGPVGPLFVPGRLEPFTAEQKAGLLETADGNLYRLVQMLGPDWPGYKGFAEQAAQRFLSDPQFQPLLARSGVMVFPGGVAGDTYWAQAREAWETQEPAITEQVTEATEQRARTAAAVIPPTETWVVGPDGQPMRVQLASSWEPPSEIPVMPTPEEEQALLDETTRGLIASGQYSEEDAPAQAQIEVTAYLQDLLAKQLAGQGAERPLGEGLPEHYVARRTMRQATGRFVGGLAGVGQAPVLGRDVEVVVEPQYYAQDLNLWWDMPGELQREIELRMEQAGLLTHGEYTPGDVLVTTAAFRQLLEWGNWRGLQWFEALSDLVARRDEGADELEFEPTAYVAPDYDTLSETVYQIFARDLGRDPEQWEVDQLASRMGGYYREQYQNQVEAERRAFMEEHEIPVDTGLTRGQTAEAERLSQQAGQSLGYIPRGAAPPMAEVDPYSSFMQFFRQRYRPETDLRKQVSSMENASDMLFGSLARMDSMIGGG